MSRRIEWAKQAQKRLARLDRPTRKRVLSAIDLLVEEGRGDVRRLEGSHDMEYRLRIGDWRVLFSNLEDGTVLIQELGSRGDIYKR